MTQHVDNDAILATRLRSRNSYDSKPETLAMHVGLIAQRHRILGRIWRHSEAPCINQNVPNRCSCCGHHSDLVPSGRNVHARSTQ
jgi:hypothetical protein